MKKAVINGWVDIAAFAAALASGVTGYVLWLYFPAGSGRGSLDLLDTGYQIWNNVHFYTSTLFFILIAVHLILHYRWIRNIRRMLVNK